MKSLSISTREFRASPRHFLLLGSALVCGSRMCKTFLSYSIMEMVLSINLRVTAVMVFIQTTAYLPTPDSSTHSYVGTARPDSLLFLNVLFYDNFEDLTCDANATSGQFSMGFTHRINLSTQSDLCAVKKLLSCSK